jgi:ELWxxDGT repeat protein
MKRFCAFALLVLGIGSAASALPPMTIRVHDLNSTGDASAGLNPRSGILFNNQLFFVGGTSNDRELWVSNLAGTAPFVEIVPGTLGSSPSSLTVAGSEFFFSAKDADHGRELWVSDGTVAGTSRLTDLRAGALDSSPSNFVVLAGDLLFRATDDGSSFTLWRTDLTTQTTAEVRSDIPLGTKIVVVAGEAFFVAANTDGREEVWRSDGTPAGTVVFTDTDCLRIGELVSAEDRAFFTCDRDLYVTDGTLAGTNLLRHFDADSPLTLTVTRTLASHGAPQVYFSASDDPVAGQNVELWVTDGTVAGTLPMPEIASGTASSRPSSFFADQGELLFSADSGDADRELYWTAGGAILGAELNTCGSGSPANYLRHGSFVYFGGCDCTAGCELFRTNRSVAGTTLIEDLEPGAGSSSIGPLASTAVGLIFSATESGVGAELWRSNGTAAGTQRLTNFEAPDSNPTGLIPTGQGVRFGASHLGGNEPWQAAANQGAAFEIADLAAGPLGSNAFRFGGATTSEGITVFVGSSTGGFNLDTVWRTDGTAPGTFALTTPEPSLSASAFTAVGRLVFFALEDSASGKEPWRTDGTVAGTYRLLDIVPGSGSSSPSNLTPSSGFLYFSATDPMLGNELWRSDGSTAGTSRITDIEPGSGSSYPGEITVAGGTVYFSASSATTGLELWTWDGGVTTLFDLAPGAASSRPDSLVPWGSGIGFVIDDANFDTELWRSDGTLSGTIQLVAAPTRGGSGEYRPLGATAAGLVYLNDLALGFDLLVASGLPGQFTWLAHFDDIVSISSEPASPLLDGVLYLGAEVVATVGEELWRTDGTPAGTEVLDLVPGPLSSRPSYLESAAGRLYFAANDLVLGRELYELVSVPLFSDDFETGNTAAWDLSSP